MHDSYYNLGDKKEDIIISNSIGLMSFFTLLLFSSSFPSFCIFLKDSWLHSHFLNEESIAIGPWYLSALSLNSFYLVYISIFL